MGKDKGLPELVFSAANNMLKMWRGGKVYM
jgi:hypothetical protein